MTASGRDMLRESIAEAPVHTAFLPYRNARAVVVGASGFIGRWVARLLSSAGADLHLFVRDAAVMQDIAKEYRIRGSIHSMDLGDPSEMDHLMAALRPSVTFNLAGYGIDSRECDPDRMQAVNDHAVTSIAMAVEKHACSAWQGLRLVHAGSALEYGLAGGHLEETTEGRPTTEYGRTKLQGTVTLSRFCSRHALRAATARLFTVYGPGEPSGRLLPSLLETSRRGGAIDLSAGQQQRDFTYVRDAAEGLLRLGISNAPPGLVVNLATGVQTSVRDFALTAARVLGMPCEALRFGVLPTRASEMHHASVSIARLRTFTNWAPGMSVEDGIRATCAFGGAGS